MLDKASKITTGAWQRANHFIHVLGVGSGSGGGTANAQADFVNALKGLASGAAYVTALLQILDTAGANGPTFTAMTWEDLAQTYGTVGIPLEVWAGKFLWNPSGKKGTDEYNAALIRAKAARALADDIRGLVRKFQLSLDMFNDVKNLLKASQGNPGGIADDRRDAA